jgi:hypothetical protein
MHIASMGCVPIEVSPSKAELNMFLSHKSLIVEIYKGLLGREPDETGLTNYTDLLNKGRPIHEILLDIQQSPESFDRQKFFLGMHSLVVFIHVCRTGGTSLHEMLMNSFPDRVFTEHGDTLVNKSLQELQNYSVLAGHFNFDSVNSLPISNISMFTFVRNPNNRLVSQYNFWRAHLPSAPSWHRGMELAHALEMDVFWNHEEIAHSTDHWNHMTWAVMGHSLWSEWKDVFSRSLSLKTRTALLENMVRLAIRRRLKKFVFVGVNEKYDESCRRLCVLMNWPCFSSFSHIHGVKQLSNTHPDFVKNHRLLKPSSNAIKVMRSLIELDLILYEEALFLFNQSNNVIQSEP